MPKRLSILKLSSAQRQLRTLESEAAQLADPMPFTHAIEGLRQQLGELEVAYEELEQQNEELSSTREELERQRHRYRHLFEEAPFGYLVTDVHGVVEEANRAAAKMFAVHQDLLPGKPLPVYLEMTDHKAFRDLLPRLCAGEPTGELEVRIKPRGREPFVAVLTAVRDLDAQNRTIRLRWTMRDVSSTRAAEEALRASEERLRHSQRLEAVGRLAGGIAHSFNNLLAAIAFQCELLCDGMPPEDERRAHVEEIQRAGERAASLARQLLAYGRKQVLQPRVMSLNGVIREMAPMLRRLIGEHIRLEIELDPKDCAIHVDLGQLEQVLLNLAVNARDAMLAGGSLRIATQCVELATGESAGAARRLLRPARRGRYRPGHSARGVGAPLRAVLHHQGARQGDRPGAGDRARHRPPERRPDPRRERAGAGRPLRHPLPPGRRGDRGRRRAATPHTRRSRRGSEVVLLVEDEDNIREPAVEILESRGYKVLSAADAVQALAAAEGHHGPIHILVTDVVMPGLSGSQLAQRLLRRRPEIQVLYISGYPEDSISHHGVLDAGQHFLQKPFPPGQFLEKVREVLDTRAPAGAA